MSLKNLESIPDKLAVKMKDEMSMLYLSEESALDSHEKLLDNLPSWKSNSHGIKWVKTGRVSLSCQGKKVAYQDQIQDGSSPVTILHSLFLTKQTV